MAHVLIIDDDDQVRAMLRRIVELAGHQVVEAENGAKGLEAVGANLPDLVITDIYMPEKEGIETIIELKREHPGLRIIAISGGAREADIDFLPVAKRLGADLTLAKPVDRAQLLEAVGSLLGEPSPPAQPA